MEFNIEIRKKQLLSLKQYVRASEDSVNAVFQTLGWTAAKTSDAEDTKVPCPINKNHLISQKSYEKHVDMCKLKTAGYSTDETFLSEPAPNGRNTIKLDNAKKHDIIAAARGSKSDFKTAWNGKDPDPMTSDRLSTTFSVDERLALFDYCVKHTEPPPKPKEFTLELPSTNKPSEKEKLSLLRDAKRRRAKYKSVHTSKKSQTEITRELIDNQMSMYVDWIKEKEEQEVKEKEKMRKRAEEKLAAKQEFHYIDTTYDQASGINVQWNQTNYSNGVITDWSHLYQGGLDTDVYTAADTTDVTYSNYNNYQYNYHPDINHQQESTEPTHRADQSYRDSARRPRSNREQARR